MKQERWLRIIPVALIMYTISYIDRTNVSLALDPGISSMMKDLGMDDERKGFAAGIFFIGYVLLQIPGGHLASHWSAKKLISILLVFWGVCAMGCGLVSNYPQFVFMRFMLGVAESGVFPATLVLLSQWFPRHERARANAFWNLCQPLAVAGSAPVTAVLLKYFGWKTMLIVEGALPFIWLPLWIYFVSDRPRDAKWISNEEREYLDRTLQEESARQAAGVQTPFWQAFVQPAVFVMLPIYFLQNCANYGLMTFLGEGLKSQGMTPRGIKYGILFAIPYAVAAVLMIVNARHSDRTHERRGHVAVAYGMSGMALIGSVLLRDYFWLSYACLCLAVPGPFTGLAPFWAIPAETMPRRVVGAVMGLVNAVGNLGGHFGNDIVGKLKKATGSINVPFMVLGCALIVAALLCFLLPRTRHPESAAARS